VSAHMMTQGEKWYYCFENMPQHRGRRPTHAREKRSAAAGAQSGKKTPNGGHCCRSVTSADARHERKCAAKCWRTSRSAGPRPDALQTIGVFELFFFFFFFFFFGQKRAFNILNCFEPWMAYRPTLGVDHRPHEMSERLGRRGAGGMHCETECLTRLWTLSCCERIRRLPAIAGANRGGGANMIIIAAAAIRTAGPRQSLDR